MPTTAIEITGLSKRYVLGERGYRTLREALTPHRKRSAPPASIWALRDIDLSVDQGEILGVVGPNGAGKSTILKIVARITEPTTGVARMRGRVGAMLEVGTGFHPELTGRENVVLNGVLIGMSRREVARQFDEIVTFAGIEEFLDTPLKRYSSGMRLRLAFAVAAHLRPEILIVDEVLAVGDLEFQRRCLDKISEIGRGGRTVLFVTHDLGAIGRLCTRAVWLDQGRLKADGSAAVIVEQYLRAGVRQAPSIEFGADLKRPVQLLSAAVTDSAGQPVAAPRRDEPLELRFRFASRVRVPGLDFSVMLLNTRGMRVIAERWGDDPERQLTADDPGDYEICIKVPAILTSGDYVVGVWLGTEFDTFEYNEVLGFTVASRHDDLREAIERDRLAQPPVEWTLRQLRGSWSEP